MINIIDIKKSEYFYLTSVPERWMQEEFDFSIGILGNLKRRRLFKLIKQLNLKFNIPEGSETFFEDEEIISFIIENSPKEELLEKLKELRDKQKIY